jgi:hypothetical protein
MHPDEVVEIAIQDLRAHLPHAHAPGAGSAFVDEERGAARGLFRALWRRYLEGWSWYARAGLTPPAAEAFTIRAPDRTTAEVRTADDGVAGIVALAPAVAALPARRAS